MARLRWPESPGRGRQRQRRQPSPQVVLRTAIVLDRATPAFDRLTGLARWGLGGRISSGRQWVSWLHVDDYLAIIRCVLDDPAFSGVVHATSPTPVTNAEFMATLRRVLRRGPAPPTPAWAVRLGAVLLRTDRALALTGRRCIPKRLLDNGLVFSFPELESFRSSSRRRPHLHRRSRPLQARPRPVIRAGG
jgi:hypothetical protein